MLDLLPHSDGAIPDHVDTFWFASTLDYLRTTARRPACRVAKRSRYSTRREGAEKIDPDSVTAR